MERLVKLNLGCGDKHWPGFINHDCEVDLKNLPYKDESVDEIHLIHVFEHLPRQEVGEFLLEWKRVLKKDGLLVMEMPSLKKIAELITRGVTNQAFTLFGIFGDERQGPLMAHKWCYTPEELEKVLKVIGFDCEHKDPVFHYKERDLRVEARKV